MSYFGHLVRHTAVYSIGVAFARLISVFLLPVYTRYISPANYGVLEMLEILNQVLSSLLGANLSSALMYFSAREETTAGRLSVVQTTLLASHAIGFISGLILWAISPLVSNLLFGTSGYVGFCRMAFLSYAFLFPQEAGLAWLRANNESGRYTLAMLIKQLGSATANVVMIAFLHWGAISFLVSSLISSALLCVYLDWRILSQRPRAIQFSLIPRLIRYSAPLAWSAIGMTFIHSGDRFFLQRFAGLTQVGLYSLGYKFGTLAGYIQPTFEIYWNAQMFQIIKGAGGERRFVRTLTYFALVSMAAAVAVSLFSQPFVILMADRSYHDARFYAPLIAITYAFRGVGDYFRGVFALHDRTSRNVLVTGSGVILSALSYAILIPTFKGWGAAIATFISFAGMFVVSYSLAQRVQAYAFEWTRLAKIGGCGALCVMGSPALCYLPLAAQFCAAAVLTLAFPTLLWLFGFFEPEEVAALHQQFRRLPRLLRRSPASE